MMSSHRKRSPTNGRQPVVTDSPNRAWRIMFALLVLLDTALSIAQVCIFFFHIYDIDKDGIKIYASDDYFFAWYAQYVHVVLFGFSLLECFMSLSGLGFNQYFSRNVNKIEFACGIILGSVMIGIIIHGSIELGELIHPFNYDIIMLILIFMWLRIVKLYILIIAIVPRFIHKVDQLLTDDMMRNYEVGKAYPVALNRTGALLNRIVYSKDVYNVLMKEIDEDRMYISKELGLIQHENPSIVTAIKTRHIIRSVINSMEGCIKDMREEGVIDMTEAAAIAESLDKNRMGLQTFKLISATPPEVILKNIPWLKDDSESLQYLLENAQLFSHDYGDVLFRAGEDPTGIHLLVSGLLKSQYVPSTTTLQVCETRVLIIPSNITNEEELKGPNGMFKYKIQTKREEEAGHKKVGFQEDESSSNTKLV